MDYELLKKYADFAVNVGVGLQKGQNLIIQSPIEGASFARLCADSAYDAGARDVVVFYSDEKFSRIKMDRTDVAVLEDIKPWQLARYLEYYEGDGGACVLNILARDPEIYKGIDVKKISAANQATVKAMKPWRDLTMGNKVQWSIVSIPTEAWASKVFPDLSPTQAVEELWDAIFFVCRVDGGDPVGAWKKLNETMASNREWLNSLDLEALHLKASNGTDIVIGLAEDFRFGGGAEKTVGGITFMPNIPTEEVFSAPHCRNINGVVKSSMPYVYNGNLIEGITARFENGRVVEYSAEKGGDILDEMLGADDGAKSLGEIALVPASSPIRKTGIIFYNTLFDENAACHIAFGAGYPDTVRGGTEMTREQLNEKGLNDSLIHEDIMIGTPDMDIKGILKDGSSIDIFVGGEWAKR